MRIFRSKRLVGDAIRRYRGYSTIGVISIVTVDLLDIALPLVLKAIIDAIEAGNRSLLSDACLLYVVISLVQTVGRVLWRVGFFQLGTKTARDTRAQLLRTFFRIPLSFFSRRKTGDLVSLVQSDLEAVRLVLEHGMIVIFDGLLYVIVIPLIMFWLSPKLALASLLLLPVVPLIVLTNEKKLKAAARAQQEAIAKLSNQAHETFSTVRLIKSFAKEDDFLNRFSHGSAEVSQRAVELARREALFSPSVEAVISVCTTVMLFVGSNLVLGDTISVGTFVAFQRYLQQLLWPTQAIGLWFAQLQRATASSERIEGVLNEPSEMVAAKVAHDSTTQPLVVSKVSFAYPGESDAVIKDISFSLTAGERIAIVGPTGSGKSTLLKLLLRVLPPNSGTLNLYGDDYRGIGIEKIRESMAFVEQAPFLYSDTLRANIAPYGTAEDAQVAATLAAIQSEIDLMPLGLESVIGERGVTLSGGQRQRVAIARALARKTPIILWDNALSAVDLVTESKILDSLRALPRSIAAIVVTHRLSTTLLMDRILVLRNGVIEQQGTHHELIKDADGWYAKFCEHQKTLSAIAALEQGGENDQR